MSKKPRRKKRKIEDHERFNNELFQDEASLTLPILASNLSTSISIIDIEKFQNISEIGCQKNNGNLILKRKRKTTIIYSDEDSTSATISPKNTRLFQSKRIQVDTNLFTRRTLYTGTRTQIYNYPERNINGNDAKNIARVTETEEKRRKGSKEKRYLEKVSYPDVNVQVISMMLPSMNESLVHNRIDQQEETKQQCTTETNERNNEKRSTEIHEKHNSRGDNVEQRELRTDVDVPNLQLGRKYPVSAKEVEILWKYTFKRDNEDSQSIRESKNLSDSNRVEYTNGVFLEKKLKIDGSVQTHRKVEQLYFNEKLGSHIEHKHLNHNKIQQNNTNNTHEDNSVNWIPKSMSKMQNCFSYVKDILIEKNHSSHNPEDACIRSSISRIFSEEETADRKTKNEFVTLFYKEKTTTSSTNFVPNIMNVTSNNPEFTLQNPYCRNYFVYFNNNVPSIPLPMSDLRLSKKCSPCKISFMKQRNLSNQQYSCLQDVAKVLVFLTATLGKIYEDEQESSYPSTKCFTSIFRIREIFRRVASISQPMYLSNNRKSRKLRKKPEILHFDSLKQQEIVQDMSKVNHSFPVCCKKRKRMPYILKDVDVVVISSNSVLVRWKVPKMLEALTKGYKIFLDNVLQCRLMYFETCAVLESVDMSKPLLITIMTFTADGYCYSTKVKTTLL